jgi:two-component system sporulation sensor kinase B
MIFPIRLSTGFLFDLRDIPFLIAALYGGYKHTFPLYLVLNVCRFIIGGNGIIQSLILSTAIFLVIPLLKKRFLKQNSRNRILMAAVVAFLTMVVFLVSLLLFMAPSDGEYWKLAINALTTYTTVMVVIVILTEQIIRNKKTRESFLYSEKLHVISELSASVSHEIRNPLTVTSGFLQLLKQSKTISEDDQRYVEFSLLEVKRAEKIVSDFLAFAKPQSENMIVSNLEEETEYVQNIITPYANMYQVKMDCRFQNDLKFQYDKNQMQQCLINLYKNGIESMKEEGGVLSVQVLEQKKNIVITIKDEGVGMTREEIARLGIPYYSTKQEGTGLGMLMVYSTIQKMNGKIDVESEKGKGTTFILTIPCPAIE